MTVWHGRVGRVADFEKKYIYEGGVRFEVTSYGLICCLEETKYKKHDCPDCKFCQWCPQNRCSGCRGEKKTKRNR
jgi:hypothetical protein